MSKQQPLPPKENALFKKIIRCYERKQYKNGLKFAKQILSNPKFAEHGETQSMKGLILNCLGKKEEAYEFVKKGLRNDLTSHVCWHVYGLVQRSDHKYDEAIKCYRNALKWQKDNMQILKDLSFLQIHMRDLEGFRETRYQLFMQRPVTKVSWIGYAMSYHLLKDYDMALNILDSFKKATAKTDKPHFKSLPPAAEETSTGTTTGASPPSKTGTTSSDKSTPAAAPSSSSSGPPSDPGSIQEKSELLLYHTMIFKEAGKYQEAYDFLRGNQSEICDKLAVHEMKTQLLLSLGRSKEAVKIIRDKLIERNPENAQYYKWLEQAYGMTPSSSCPSTASPSWNESHRLKLYHDFQSLYPRSQLPLRIPLSFVQDPVLFRQLLDPYVRQSLCKGQPALFRDLKSIYQQELGPSKFKRRQEEVYRKHFLQSDDGLIINDSQQNGQSCVDGGSDKNIFPPSSLPVKIDVIESLMKTFYENLKGNLSFDSDESTSGSEDPTRILWTAFFLAQHYDYLGHYEEALKLVSEALEHTPTLIELHVLKAKIFRHSGNLEEAVKYVDEAQSLDTADRYLNSKCAKYLLRADRVPEAEVMCGKFTREGNPASDSLNEMQCMWFQTEAALSYQRLGRWGEALKKCIEIERHFIEITEDQFDFHIYCMRKMTLRAYIGLLRLEDVLRSHPFYFTAAKIAIEVYLRLYDHPLAEDDASSNLQTANMSASEIKKVRNKERRERIRKEKEQEKNSTAVVNDKTAANPDASPSDPVLETLDPSKLERTEDPLNEALRFLKPLQLLARDRMETHLLSFEIHYRRDKIMLMLQSLKRAVSLHENSSNEVEETDSSFPANYSAKTKKDGEDKTRNSLQNYPCFQRQLKQFFEAVQQKKDQLSSPVKEVLQMEVKRLTSFSLSNHFSEVNIC